MTSRRTFLRTTATAALLSTVTLPRAATAGPGSPALQRFAGALNPGDVVRHGALTLVWLHGGESGPSPAVATLDDAQGQGDLLIAERGSATVPELIVDNRGKTHVLLMAGEILVGGKQNRVLREDLLLPPRSGPRSISVYCVEQGRWSGSRKDFESKASVAQPSLRREVIGEGDQNRVWAEVHRSVRAARPAAPSAASPTQSYQQLYEAPEVRRRLDDTERAIDARGAAAGAVGAMVVTGDEIAGLDAFQDASLFKRQWRKLLRSYAVDAATPPRRTHSDDDLRAKARGLLTTVAAAGGTARGNAGVGQLFELRTKDFKGAALDFEGRVVHLAVV